MICGRRLPQEKKGVTGLPTIDMNATGKNILRLRINAGLTVKQLVDIFGVITPQAVYKWQNGEALPTLDNLVVLSKVFGVPMDEILRAGREQGFMEADVSMDTKG